MTNPYATEDMVHVSIDEVEKFILEYLNYNDTETTIEKTEIPAGDGVLVTLAFNNYYGIWGKCVLHRSKNFTTFSLSLKTELLAPADKESYPFMLDELKIKLRRLGKEEKPKPEEPAVIDDAIVRYGTDGDLSLSDVKNIVKRCNAFVASSGKVTEFYNKYSEGKFTLETLRKWIKDPKFID